MELEQLPRAWLLRFAQVLPAHLKLKLRQCSRGMLELVDSSSELTVRCNPSAFIAPNVMMDLMHKHVVSIDVSSLPDDAAAFFNVPLPRLRRLTGQLRQHRLLSAIAAATAPHGSLKQLQLCCCGACFNHHDGGDETNGRTELRLAWSDKRGLLDAADEHLAACIEELTLTGNHHCFTTSRPSAFKVGWFVQQLTNLKSLSIPVADQDPQAFAQGLASCLKLLQGLTQLTVNSRCECAESSPGLSIDLRHLTRLQSLCLSMTYDGHITSSGLRLLPGGSNITSLQLIAGLDSFDISVLAGLPHLQQLKCLSNSWFESSDFQPLTACRQLTSLSTDSFLLVQSPVPQYSTTAAPAGTPVGATELGAVDCEAGRQPSGPQQVSAPAAAGGGSTWSLPSLKCLSVGSLGLAEYLAPVSSFAPHLTRLQDTFWDGFSPWPNASRGAAEVDALAGLQALQVLSVDLFTLDRHARHLASLTGLSTLQQLEVEMVGAGFAASPNMQQGLPRMPHLTRLLMYTNEDVHGEWAETYNSAEDAMLWRSQAQLKVLEVRGSIRLGGFLVDAGICTQLPKLLPVLVEVVIEQCPDLGRPALTQLVAVAPSPVVRLRGCAPVTETDCCEVSTELVSVEFSR